jgi:antitoxin ParD1/3/4
MCIENWGIIETVGTGRDISVQEIKLFLLKNNSILNIWCKFTPTKIIVMARQSISLANQNDEWLKQQISKEEFTSKSEAVNYLIKQAREREEYVEFVRMKLDIAEKSGLAKKQTREEMLAEFKKKLNV